MPITFNPNVSFKQQAPQMPLNPVTENIYSSKQIEAPEQKKKPSKLINGISNIAKFFASVNEITKGIVKGTAYGAATTVTTLGAFWLLGGLPKAIKTGKEAVKDTLKHPLKNTPKVGKLIAGVVSTGVFVTHIVKAILNKNQRNSDIEHKLQTGHTV